MSDYGRFWSLKIRGLTIAERAVVLRLGERHNAKTGRCFPGRESLTFELECSKNYLTQIFTSIEEKLFFQRKGRFDGKGGAQSSNQFDLNFERWFPFYSKEVEEEEKRLLGYFRRAVESPELAQGIHSVWLEKPYVRTNKQLRNDFRKQGRSRHTNRPVSAILWVAVASKAHEDHIRERQADVVKEIAEDTGHLFEVKVLRVWIKSSD